MTLSRRPDTPARGCDGWSFGRLEVGHNSGFTWLSWCFPLFSIIKQFSVGKAWCSFCAGNQKHHLSRWKSICSECVLVGSFGQEEQPPILPGLIYIPSVGGLSWWKPFTIKQLRPSNAISLFVCQKLKPQQLSYQFSLCPVVLVFKRLYWNYLNSTLKCGKHVAKASTPMLASWPFLASNDGIVSFSCCHKS